MKYLTVVMALALVSTTYGQTTIKAKDTTPLIRKNIADKPHSGDKMIGKTILIDQPFELIDVGASIYDDSGPTIKTEWKRLKFPRWSSWKVTAIDRVYADGVPKDMYLTFDGTGKNITLPFHYVDAYADTLVSQNGDYSLQWNGGYWSIGTLPGKKGDYYVTEDYRTGSEFLVHTMYVGLRPSHFIFSEEYIEEEQVPAITIEY